MEHKTSKFDTPKYTFFFTANAYELYIVVFIMDNMGIAAKCAPVEAILDVILESGITAVELYTDTSCKLDQVIHICNKYPFKYAIHAPTEGYEPDLLVSLAEQIKAKIVIFHNIYWEDEWSYIVEKFKSLNCKICLENMSSAVEQIKYMRRFGMGRCLDLEHLILEVNGIYEEPFLNIMRQTSHVHMTGYVWGSDLWHTPMHHSPEQSMYLLTLLKRAGYRGFVVSEARESYQTLDEFKALYNFFINWEDTLRK